MERPSERHTSAIRRETEIETALLKGDKSRESESILGVLELSEVFRVFYDVPKDDEIVKIVAIGLKEGNDLYIHGERYEL